MTYQEGYWSYQYCQGIEIRQFHVASKEQRDPDWSLGIYVPHYIKSKLFNTNSGGIGIIMEKGQLYGKLYYREIYEDGQICHENNIKRHSEVKLIYCGEYEVFFIILYIG